LPQQLPSEREEAPDRPKIIAALLAGLTGHFYRPEMAEGLARQVLLDFVSDLRDFDISDIRAAVETYRRNPASKKFPTPGQLRELAAEAQNERRARATASASPPQAMAQPAQGDRPNLWWMKPREHWDRNWSERDVPMGEKVKHNGKWREPERVVF